MGISNERYWKAILNIALSVIVVMIIVWLMPKVIVYFMPFVVGSILAGISSPIVQFLEKKFRIKRKASSAIIVVIVITSIILISYTAISRLISECIGYVNTMPIRIEGLEQDFEQVKLQLADFRESLPLVVQDAIEKVSTSISQLGISVLSQIGEPTVEAVGNFAKQVPLIIVGTIMALLSAYFFVVDKDDSLFIIKQRMPKACKQGYKILKKSLFKAIGGYFKAQLIIEVWMYIGLVIGFVILKVEYILPVALGIAILDFLPIFGTGTILIPWAIIEFLSGDYQMTIGLVIMWGGGQLLRQIIQPKIVGDSIGLPPIPTLFLLYIGYRSSGLIGLIMAVPIGMVVYSLYQEGMFDTLEKSIYILGDGLNEFRKITPSDLENVKKYKDNKTEN